MSFLPLQSYLCSGIWALAAVGILAPQAASAAASAPPMPPSEDIVAWQRVDTMLNNSALPAKTVIPTHDMPGWLAFEDYRTEGKENYTGRWSVRKPPFYKGDVAALLKEKHATFKPAPVAPGAPAEMPPSSGTHATPISSTTPKTKSPYLPGFKLRQSYSDVLSIEDPSIADGKNPTKLDDLKGASFSYTRDFRTNSDIWAATGAVIFPFLLPGNEVPNYTRFGVLSWGFVPSVEINRVSGFNKATSNATTETKDIDQLAARLGIFSKFNLPSETFRTVTVRGFATESTDTSLRSNIPVGQVEVEPQIHIAPKLNIGFSTRVIPKTVEVKEGATDYYDNSYLSYLFRLRMHYEGGDVLDAGKGTEPTRAFERIGPIVELRLVPLVFKQLSLTLSDSYLCTITGPDDRQNLLTVSTEYKIYDNRDTQQSISLKAIYRRGGIDLTKQRVDDFQIGLGGTF